MIEVFKKENIQIKILYLFTINVIKKKMRICIYIEKFLLYIITFIILIAVQLRRFFYRKSYSNSNISLENSYNIFDLITTYKYPVQRDVNNLTIEDECSICLDEYQYKFKSHT